jgi:hypothetical protein
MKRKHLLLGVFCFFFTLVGFVNFAAATLRYVWQNAYYAKLGTLPTAQGWPFVEGNGSSPEPTVTDGILHQGPTSTADVQAWVKTGSFCHFRGNRPFVMECKLKIISSNLVYFSGGGWHTGWHCAASDQDRSYFALNIADMGVRMTNTSDFWPESNCTPIIYLDTTSDFNVYRVVLFNGTGQLYINDTFIASLPIGAVDDHDPFLAFGDPSALPTCEIEMEYMCFGVVAEPADLNADGRVDLADFAVFASRWLENGCGLPDWCGNADLDLTGSVDTQDLIFFASFWLDGTPKI